MTLDVEIDVELLKSEIKKTHAAVRGARTGLHHPDGPPRMGWSR